MKKFSTNNTITKIENTAISVQDHTTVDEVVNGQWHNWGIVIDANPIIASGWSGVRVNRIYGNGRVEVTSNIDMSNGTLVTPAQPHYAIGVTNLDEGVRLLMVYDVWGRTFLMQKLDAGTTTYNCHTANMDSGIYQVIVQQEGRRNLSANLSITH